MADADIADPPPQIVRRLREVCLSLPDAYEEPAWVGTRWRVRGRTFAHVLDIELGHPAAYAWVVGADRPMTVLSFRATDEEMNALLAVGPPFFRGRWGRDVMILVLGDHTDWTEVAELLTESYCVLAPKKLVAQVRQPGGEDGQSSERPARQ
ncbi:MmcQ/YjbR family DNA-binding protein [Jiangella asiatica]|uniref:MmcQ/YjbR family DNA-binding protein n=1 Tax=Jiangella asiatica TaxID=2530372 RepID=A0A4R5CIC3_9ACTN|nr:MmcQ/YjbR family DNA-binding protein [Jiangella asiatica]TDD99988.1 MmcQ/YjbR family DNA-binding protein [Jiangella asiatica]